MKTQLQTIRRSAGFKSARAFAEHIGMNPGTYTAYEQGRRPITLDLAWDLADVLECSLDELAGREWPPAGESAPARDQNLVGIEGAYASMNGSGRTALAMVASALAADPANSSKSARAVSEAV